MDDIVIVLVVALIVGLAVLYVYKSKKSGKKCIGCPNSCVCSQEQKNSCGSSKT